jgi:hypothetical protein
MAKGNKWAWGVLLVAIVAFSVLNAYSQGVPVSMDDNVLNEGRALNGTAPISIGEAFRGIFYQVIVPALITALTALIAFLVSSLKLWINNKVHAQVVTRLVQYVEVAVNATMQELGDELKAKAADGKLEPQEKAQLKAMAKEKVLGLCGGLKDEAKKYFSDYDQVINDLIEAVVAIKKK